MAPINDEIEFLATLGLKKLTKCLKLWLELSEATTHLAAATKKKVKALVARFEALHTDMLEHAISTMHEGSNPEHWRKLDTGFKLAGVNIILSALDDEQPDTRTWAQLVKQPVRVTIEPTEAYEDVAALPRRICKG